MFAGQVSGRVLVLNLNLMEERMENGKNEGQGKTVRKEGTRTDDGWACCRNDRLSFRLGNSVRISDRWTSWYLLDTTTPTVKFKPHTIDTSSLTLITFLVTFFVTGHCVIARSLVPFSSMRWSRFRLPSLLRRSHNPLQSSIYPSRLPSVRSFSFSSSLQSLEMETVDTTKRLAHLRELMQKNKVDIYIVPSEDSHQSEYIAPCDARREYICGFTGSAGTAVITLDKAALATDGRYFNQASKQLDANWLLLKQGLEDVPTWQEWYA